MVHKAARAERQRASGPSAHSATAKVELAQAIVRLGRSRELHLPKCALNEAAWNMLLDLFCSHANGRTTSVTSACIASGVPSTTALRHITVLVDEGLLLRRTDPRDGRRVFLELAPAVHDALAACLGNMLHQLQALLI